MQWPGGAKWALSLSFDDGYWSNFRGAAPALEAEGARGTFFMVGNKCCVGDAFFSSRQGGTLWSALAATRAPLRRLLGVCAGEMTYRVIRRVFWAARCLLLALELLAAALRHGVLSPKADVPLKLLKLGEEVFRFDLWATAHRLLRRKGHELAHHSFSHPCYDKTWKNADGTNDSFTFASNLVDLTREQVLADITRGVDEVCSDLGGARDAPFCVPCGECECGLEGRNGCFVHEAVLPFRCAIANKEPWDWEEYIAPEDFVFDVRAPDAVKQMRYLKRYATDDAHINPGKYEAGVTQMMDQARDCGGWLNMGGHIVWHVGGLDGLGSVFGPPLDAQIMGTTPEMIRRVIRWARAREAWVAPLGEVASWIRAHH